MNIQQEASNTAKCHLVSFQRFVVHLESLYWNSVCIALTQCVGNTAYYSDTVGVCAPCCVTFGHSGYVNTEPGKHSLAENSYTAFLESQGVRLCSRQGTIENPSAPQSTGSFPSVNKNV